MDALNGNFGAKIGIFDPDDIVADDARSSATDKHLLELKLKSLIMVVLVI